MAAADPHAVKPKADPPKRKRRWFQFSLRSLLLVVTLLAILCGYVGQQVEFVRAREVMAAAPGVDSVVAADSRDNITALTSGSGAARTNGDSREKIPWFR